MMTGENKIGIVLPYFGKFPAYFPLWLLSVRGNPTIDWLLFTDNTTVYDYPANVKVFHTSFSWIKGKIQEKFDFKIRLDSPWGLCAFKVSYGEVFEEYLREYAFWGYCDCDVIFGNIRTFISDDILKEYDKILWLGHLSLVRNTKEINGVYKLRTRAGEVLYRRAFEESSVACFDEVGMNDILVNNGFKLYQKVNFADFIHRAFLFNFIIAPERYYDTEHRVFTWDKGRLFCHELYNGRVFSTEFLYVHFCRRPMQVGRDLDKMIQRRVFAIVPGKFISCEEEIGSSFIRKHTRRKIYWKYILPRLKFNRNLLQRCKNVILELCGKSTYKEPPPKYWLTNGRR